MTFRLPQNTNKNITKEISIYFDGISIFTNHKYMDTCKYKAQTITYSMIIKLKMLPESKKMLPVKVQREAKP